MDFKKYNSIENSYRQKDVQAIQVDFPNELFVIQEKVHGANFSFWTDGKEVICAKRTAFLKEGDSFYDWEIIYDRYKDSVLGVFNKITPQVLQYMGINDSKIEQITIHGELYGGIYPHPDVGVSSCKTVQKGVFYAPDVQFITFDVKVNGKLIGINHCERTCTLAEIPYCKTLFQGTLLECLDYSKEYQTTIPKTHGLPEIEDNICEGNVIKTFYPRFHGNGQRVILKNKNEKFAEKKQSKKVVKPPKEVPEHIQTFQLEAVKYITENRLRNVISKIGKVDQKKGFGKLLGLLGKDVMEDFTKDFPEVGELPLVEKKMITKLVNNECGNLIRPNFINICDGEF